MLPLISKEQQDIIDSLTDKNVVVDSVAGSGKTTTNLHISLHFNEKNILLLTYNSKLKIETREKVVLLGIHNLEVHSYHSFCVKYYDNLCFTDSIINQIIKDNYPLLSNIDYDLIILDEAQDITFLYYKLFCKIYKDNNKNIKICVLGDKNQSIFDFNGSDERFLLFYDKVFCSNFSWKYVSLSYSFRITFEISKFINRCMLNHDRIFSNKKNGIKPRYIICDVFENIENNKIINELKYYLYELNYEPKDIFILAPSIKSEKSPIRKLENNIKRFLKTKSGKEISIYVPFHDDEILDMDIIQNKMIFSTFHQTKGLERKVVIIIGFDNSYMEFYKRNCPKNICPNELYVATTRSSECLSLIHSSDFPFLSFLNLDKITKYTNLIYGTKYLNIRPDSLKSSKKFEKKVCELIRHISQEFIDELIQKYIQINIINPPDPLSIIHISHKSEQIDGFENVCDITGIAIPAYYEYTLTNNITIYNELIKLGYNILPHPTPENLLYISNIWSSYNSKFIFKTFQITKYDWLDQDTLDKSILNIKKLGISKSAIFEKKFDTVSDKLQIFGSIDCIDNNCVYEFKCSQKLEKEHILQLSIYMYLCLKSNVNYQHFYLFNILTCELIEINSTISLLNEMINDIIQYKYGNKCKIDDSTFISICQKLSL
uniref:Uncharacterized protein n=1 Tax=viral metagenome TaxID=1070528 RepID=A0A6C0H504_9ZZZZ